MTVYPFETDLTLNHQGNNDGPIQDPFRAALKLISADLFDVSALTNPPDPPGDSTWTRVEAGTTMFGFQSGTSTPMPGDRLLFTSPFGMEAAEYLAWWYNGGGEALVAALYATSGFDVVQFPLCCQAGEASGWWKEALTLKKLNEGLYADGAQISARFAGEAGATMGVAFPNVDAPPATPTVSFLGDVINGTYNGGEFQQPRGEASVINGLFPNYPNVGGSIIDAGLTHYYMDCWHSPVRVRVMWVNKTFYDGLTAAQQAMIAQTAKAASLQNLADSMAGNDVFIKQFQALGATIHERLPRDVSSRLRDAYNQVLDDAAAADDIANPGVTSYSQLLTSQRNFMKANQVRWRATGSDRKMRFDLTALESDLQPG